MKLLAILVSGLCATALASSGDAMAAHRNLWGWSSPTPAPATTSIHRPASRPLVKCTWWCPPGYTRRDVTIGPSCSFWQGGLGKCVDNQKRFLDEGCDDSAHTGCNGGLVCASVAQGSAASNACACSKTCQQPGGGRRRQLTAADAGAGAGAGAPEVAARRLTTASRRRMLRAFAEAKRRRLISRSTEYCREDAPMGLGGDCYASFQREKNTLPACSLANAALNQGAAGKACLCPAAGAKKELRGCDLESGPPGSAGYKIAHCAERVEYVARGAESGPSVCKKYVLHDQWASKGRQGPLLACTSGWWKWNCCLWKSGYTWRNGRCEAKTRNIGEKCGDEWGVCSNPDKSYAGHRLSCAVDSGAPGAARCVPSLYDVTRNECTCAWFSWWLGFACGSNDCNGHSCVLSTGDGKKYCDYNTGNDW